jgi:hypothetical protein
MTNEQLYLAIGLPRLLNAATMGLPIAYLGCNETSCLMYARELPACALI